MTYPGASTFPGPATFPGTYAGNPNWPLFDYAWCPAAGPSQSPQQAYWASLTERMEGQFTCKRGKTYELDQVQSLEGSFTIRNDDGAFDPTNTASVYNGWVIPYRLFRARAQWPASINLLTQNQACAGDADTAPAQCEQPLPAGATVPAGANVTSAWPLSIVNEGGNAYQGSQVWSVAVPASQSASFPYVIAFQGVSVAPGQAYSAQFHARCLTPGANPVVSGVVTFYDASGNVIGNLGSSAAVTLTGSPTAGWSQVTVSNAVAPANAAGMQIILWENGVGPASAHTIEVDGNQVEKSATASAWSRPGVWYPLATGYIERWPQQWTSGGNYGTITCPIVDLFAFLSQHQLTSPAMIEMLALNPNWFYPLQSSLPGPIFTDLTNQRKNIGTRDETAFNTPNTVSTTSSLTAQVGNPPLGVNPAGMTVMSNPQGMTISTDTYVIDLAPTDGAVLGPPRNVAFTRVFGIMPSTSTYLPNGVEIWRAEDAAGQASISLYLGINTGQLATAVFNSAGTLLGGVAMSTGLALGKWHLVGVGLSADGLTITLFCDGAVAGTATLSAPALPSSSVFACDVIGDQPSYGVNGFNGNLCYAAEFPTVLTSAQFAELSNVFLYGSVNSGVGNETSDSRYASILKWAGVTAPQRLSVGSCKSMGPATDAVNAATLQVLQNVVDTEGGQHFIGADGAVVFQSRADRYDKPSLAAFGENNGETPYTDATVDFDPTRVGNDVQVTQTFGNTLFRQQDTTSQSKYGAISLSRTVNSTDANELNSAAQGLLYWNKDPLARLEALPFDVARQGTAAWPVMLARELGDAVTVNRRPSNAPQISIPGFVEQIEWTIGDDVTAGVNLQITNSAKHVVWKVEDPTYGHFDQYPVAY